MNIKKGDNVIVIAGKDKGKDGKISQVIRSKERVVIEGVNVMKRHRRPQKQGQAGQIVEFSAPVHVSNVAIKDPKTGKATRIGYKISDGKKVRVTKASGTELK